MLEPILLDPFVLLHIIDPDPPEENKKVLVEKELTYHYWSSLNEICSDVSNCDRGHPNDFYCDELEEYYKSLTAQHIFHIMPEFASGMATYLNSGRKDFSHLKRTIRDYQAVSKTLKIAVPRITVEQKLLYEGMHMSLDQLREHQNEMTVLSGKKKFKQS